MSYGDFLVARRPRMAELIRIAFRKLGGEASALPLVPPWFLPGAEVVWQRIGDVELKLRALVREVYRQRFGDQRRQPLKAHSTLASETCWPVQLEIGLLVLMVSVLSTISIWHSCPRFS